MFAILLLCAVPPQDGILHDRFDLVEINHYYSGSCANSNHAACQRNLCRCITLSQFIFWTLTDDGYVVDAWLLLKPGETRVDGLDVVNTPGTCYAMELDHDGVRITLVDEGRIRHIRAPVFRETWTTYDPELADRKTKHRRRGLIKRLAAPSVAEFPLPLLPIPLGR